MRNACSSPWPSRATSASSVSCAGEGRGAGEVMGRSMAGSGYRHPGAQEAWVVHQAALPAAARPQRVERPEPGADGDEEGAAEEHGDVEARLVREDEEA